MIFLYPAVLLLSSSVPAVGGAFHRSVRYWAFVNILFVFKVSVIGAVGEKKTPTAA
jgi:hypothetical protein